VQIFSDNHVIFWVKDPRCNTKHFPCFADCHCTDSRGATFTGFGESWSCSLVLGAGAALMTTTASRGPSGVDLTQLFFFVTDIVQLNGATAVAWSDNCPKWQLSKVTTVQRFSTSYIRFGNSACSWNGASILSLSHSHSFSPSLLLFGMF
jgi:hypothetical protein